MSCKTSPGVCPSQWVAADAKGVSCCFDDLPEGSYAVAIGHDLNGNKRVDTNFFGIPTEQWGVSRIKVAK